MKLKAIIFSTIISVLILALSSCMILTSAETSSVETEATTAQEIETTTGISETTDTTSQNSASDLIKVTIPQPNQIIEDPLIIEGEAHGSWYFEGVFPFMLQDANGTVIIRYFAQAQGDSMVDDFVPFRAEIGFEKNPGTETGVLILEKENPSALPEYGASIEIPVRFNVEPGKIVEDADPQKGEYFVYAELISIDAANNKIIVEQKINEPNEKIISPEVTLSDDCKIVKSILEMPEGKETVTEISLESIGLGEEIGIIFKSDDTARAIIYQEMIEN